MKETIPSITKLTIIHLSIIIIMKSQFSMSYLDSFFRLEEEKTNVGEHIKPFLNESFNSEIECYMKCLNNRNKCSLLQIKKGLDAPVLCLLYNITIGNTESVPRESNTSTASVVANYVRSINHSIANESRLLNQTAHCLAWYNAGYTDDGVYDILVNGTKIKVFCDMTTNGGGWTVLQRRINGTVDFHRTWDEYKNGFGEVNGEYWLGNDFIHLMTKGHKNISIRIEGVDFQGERKHITFKGFWLEGEVNKYKIHFGTFKDGDKDLSGDLLTHDSNFFTTKDDDNDSYSSNCAIIWGGGWWFTSCFSVNLNGYYSHSENITYGNGITWHSWTSFYKSLKSVKMQFK